MIDRTDIKAVSNVLASGMIAQGKKVKEFEDAIARFVGTKYAVAVSSGTSSLHVALLCLGVGNDDEVIMPSYVCSSPYFATMQAGAVPKIVDIDPKDMNICAATAKSAISSKTKAIVVPHMFGNPAELDELLDLDIPVIEDCAQSLGAEYRKRQVGSFGAVSVFSFYATKMITTGEGGMILTNDHDLFGKMVELRDYDKKALQPTKYNYKMTDFQAALGLSQLKKLQSFIESRRRIASLYTERFSDYEVEPPDGQSDKDPVFFRYVIGLNKMTTVQKRAKKNGVICERPIYKPLHEYQSSSECPNCQRAHDHALSIPLYPSLSRDEIEYVITTMEKAFRET